MPSPRYLSDDDVVAIWRITAGIITTRGVQDLCGKLIMKASHSGAGCGDPDVGVLGILCCSAA